MRRLEAERIDGVPAGNRRPGWGRRCGLRALRFRPPTPVDGLRREPPVWCGARAPCLARTAPGRPRDPARRSLRAALRGARCTIRGANAATETRPRGLKSPPVERREASASIARRAAAPTGVWMRLSALRFPRAHVGLARYAEKSPRGGMREKGKPGAQMPTRRRQRFARAAFVRRTCSSPPSS